MLMMMKTKKMTPEAPSIAHTINNEKEETKWKNGGREAKTINDDTDIWCAPVRGKMLHTA